MNTVFLRGEAVEPAVFSHESHGVRYYQINLSVPRLSEARDVLRIIIPAESLRAHCPRLGDKIEVEGQLRSYNNKSGVGSRLVVSVLAKSLSLCEGDAESANRVELSGSLCKQPVYRKTPLGREICDMLVAVGRPYGRADYLPIICWGHTARMCSELEVGARIDIAGRFQSRVYIKQVEDKTVERVAYEVSAIKIEVTTD